MDADPGRLSELEERMAAVRRLERKHGGDVDVVLKRAAAAREELALLDDVEERLVDAEAAVDAALRDAQEAARGLTRARTIAAGSLSAAITKELGDLGMGHARVEVDLQAAAGPAGFVVDGAALGPDGAEHVEFLIAPNPGEAPRPLREIASGGELSRSLLAVKRVLAERGPVGTYVFDEVDSGVGGAVADAIGRKLADVAKHHQVICITHHAQIAAWGDRHLRVEKEVVDGRTASRVVDLPPDERIEEMARMIGSGSVRDAARMAAAELLDTARGAALTRA